MTTSPQTPTTTEPTYAEEYDRLWNEAVTTLTAAVRLHHPTGDPLDFAGFLASALAAVAGNVGSLDRVTAGRPGSWESALLDQLVCGTVGDDPDDLLAARTEPVIVQLNVAQMVSEEQFEGSAEERAEKLPNFVDAEDDLAKALLSVPDPDDAPSEEQERAWETAAADLRRRYAEAYEAYARRFTTAVLEAAARDMSTLKVPVEVQADSDPESSWWSPGDITNPDDLWDERDELNWRLWAVARAKVGLPTLAPQGD